MVLTKQARIVRFALDAQIGETRALDEAGSRPYRRLVRARCRRAGVR